jgi:hypothetical protein
MLNIIWTDIKDVVVFSGLAKLAKRRTSPSIGVKLQQ